MLCACFGDAMRMLLHRLEREVEARRRELLPIERQLDRRHAGAHHARARRDAPHAGARCVVGGRDDADASKAARVLTAAAEALAVHVDERARVAA